MDPCRQQLDIEIDRVAATATMLDHLARVVEEGPGTNRRTAYQSDAVEALLHGAEIARNYRESLRHCAEIYDDKIAAPLPDPSEATA